MPVFLFSATTFRATSVGVASYNTRDSPKHAQEALANALRHAHASSIKVTLDIEPASVRPEICDDGKGLTVPEFSATGLGLRTMRYRASLLGAKFQIKRLDDTGTCVVSDCPQVA